MLTDFGGLKVWNEIWQSITRSFGKLLVQEWFFKEENSRSRNHEGIIFSTKQILPQIRSLVSTWRLKQWRLHSRAAETRESTVIKCNPGSTTQTQWPQGGAVGTSCIYLVKTKNRNKKIMKAFNKNPSWTDPARGRRDVRVLHPSQSDRDSHQFTDFINWKGGCVGGAAGADCLIRWFLTDLPTSFLSLFSSLGAGRWELAVIFMHSDDAFKWLSYYTAVVKKQNLAAVLASCRQKEAIKAKTPSRLDGWGAPFSLLSQLLLPKITEELRGSFSQLPASQRSGALFGSEGDRRPLACAPVLSTSSQHFPAESWTSRVSRDIQAEPTEGWSLNVIRIGNLDSDWEQRVCLFWISFCPNLVLFVWI